METMPDLLAEPATTGASGDPMRPRPYRIVRFTHNTHDTFTVALGDLEGTGGIEFRPGQFNMLYLYGIGEIPISISGDPADRSAVIHTTRAVGTVTKAMRRLRKGDTLGLRGPFGQPWPVERAHGRDVVIVAGGIGLAPLRPVLYHLIKHRNLYNKVVLLYGTRSPVDILYREELEAWRARFDLDVYVTVDRGMEGWRGNVGFVSGLIGKAPFEASQTTAFLCGPEVMMRVCAGELLNRGVPDGELFISMERNMKCGIGFCGHCQLGPFFICKDGPVFPYPKMRELLSRWEL
jgi:NAD(P)H-flavin reductase